MMVIVRAVYRDGKLEPLDAVNLQEGQEVQLQIVETSESLRDLLEDLLVKFKADTTPFDEEAAVRDLDEVLLGKRPLSEIIIEDRD